MSTEPEVKEGQPEQTPQGTTETTPSEDGGQSEEGWWDTAGLDEKTSKRIKSIQVHVTKKNMEHAETKTKAATADKLTSELEQLRKGIVEAFQDPKKFEEARNQYLGIKTETKEPVPKKMETVEDLVSYFGEREKYALGQLEQKFNTRLTEEINRIATPVYKDRWDSALKKVGEKFPRFKEVQAQVVNLITSGPYQGLYGKMAEVEILEKVFKAEYADKIIEDVKQSSSKVLEKKKTSVTEKPKGRIPTQSAGKLDKEDIIARVRERFG